MCFILQTRQPKSSLVRFEFQLVQLPVCSLVSFQAFQVHIANGQRPDVPSVILLGNRQPGPLQSTNSAHHWSWRSSGHPHLPQTEKAPATTIIVFKISGGKNSAHKPYQTILVKVRSYSITNRQHVKQAQKMVYAWRADASWNRKKSRNKWSKIVSANCEKESEKSPAKGLKSSKFLKSFKTPDCSNCGLDRNKRQLSDPHLLIS